jgi:hypothetical protein
MPGNKHLVTIPEEQCVSLLGNLEKLNIPFYLEGEPWDYLESLIPLREKPSKWFDINRCLRVFEKVKLTEGYILDYFYTSDTHEGKPVPFTRKTTSPLNFAALPQLSLAALFELSKFEISKRKLPPEFFYNVFYGLRELKMIFSWGDLKILQLEPLNDFDLACKYSLIKDVEFENSPLGYFQFALFNLAVRNFYLSSFNHIDFIFSKQKLEEINESIGSESFLGHIDDDFPDNFKLNDPIDKDRYCDLSELLEAVKASSVPIEGENSDRQRFKADMKEILETARKRKAEEKYTKRKRIKNIRYGPIVEMKEKETAKVTMLVSNRKGICYLYIYVRRPNIIERVDEKIIVREYRGLIH